MYPDLTVVASKVGLMYLKGFIHRPFKQQAVKGGDVIDLGKGHRLEFNTTPNLHWPDTMFSFDHGTGAALQVRCRALSASALNHATGTSCRLSHVQQVAAGSGSAAVQLLSPQQPPCAQQVRQRDGPHCAAACRRDVHV